MRFDQIDDTITEVAIERPLSFTVNRKTRFSIYPPSLGKFLMYQRLLKQLGLSLSSFRDDVSLLRSIIKLSRSNEKTLLRLIAYSTLPGDSCLYEDKVEKRLSELKRLKSYNICQITLAILTQDDTDKIMKETGLEFDMKDFSKICEVKNQVNSDSLSFGGKTIWGNLIDPACERYGWTYQYVLWGISFSSLRFLMSDHVKTISVSKKEKEISHFHNSGNVIKAEDKSSLKEYIMQQNWS